MRKRIKKIDRAAYIADNANLLVSERVDGERLYELFELKFGGHFVRITSKKGERIKQVEHARALKIIEIEKSENSARLRQSMNPKLNTGFSVSEDGVRYDTKTDKLLDVVERDEENMAAVYETAGGHSYLHIIEHNRECVYVVEQSSVVERLLELWSCGSPTLVELLNCGVDWEAAALESQL
jgi:hypothetical protein